MPQAQTLTIAQALQSNQSGLTVQDTAANIAQALPNAALVARVTMFELSGPARLAAAAADQLAALGSKFTAGYALAVQDSLAAMTSPANAAGLALASSRGIIDAAYNLLAAAPGAFSGISSVTVTGTPALSAAQLVRLEALPGFSFASGAHFTLTDSLAAAGPLLVFHPGWFAAASGVTVRLDGSQVSAGVASALAALANGGKTVTFTPGIGDTTLNINSAAHDLATAAASLNRVGQLVGLHITVSNEGSAISAADAVGLTTIAGFAPAQHTLTVADTGAAISAVAGALFNHGYPQIAVTSGNLTAIAAQLLDPTLRVMAGATVTLAGTPTLTTAQAQTLSGLPGFSLGQGATLTVADTISHILAHPAALAPATAIVATDSETVSAANLTALAQIAAAHGGHFSLGGHTLTVVDTPASLAALGNGAIGLGTQYALSANGMVSAAQFSTLRNALHVAANGHGLTVSDTTANLLALSGDLSLAASTQLSADGSASAAGAQSLAARPGFSTAGHVLTIADTAANLLGLSPSVQALAGHLTLNADQSVTGAQAQALAALGGVFSTGGHAVIVTDTAGALLSLPSQAGAIATGYGLSADATVSAAQFTTLAGTLEVARNGHALTVFDTAANLLALPPQLTAQASGFMLSGGGSVSGAQFVALRDGLGVAGNGHTLTVSDTASNLLALSGSLALDGSTQLSADANVTAAQAQSLAATPGFGTAGHALTITDTAGALLALPGGVQALATQMVLGGSQSVSASQAVSLAGLGSAFSTGGASLTVTDTAANLLALPMGVNAIASAYALNADAGVNAAQFIMLYSPLHVALNGHALSVTDTAANLLTIPAQALGQASAFLLGAEGTVSAAQFATLRDTMQVGGNGHSLTLSDTAAHLLGVSGDLTLISATHLSADANVTAAQAQALLADPGFGTAGHVLTITDSAANLLGLPGGLAGLSGQLVLAADQSVTAAQAAALLALGSVFSTGGHALVVTDTAASLLGLPVGTSAIATGYALSADATVSASGFSSLTAGLGVALNGHGLAVADTPANLLALTSLAPQYLSQASGFSLSAGGTVSEAQFATLRDTLGVAGNGHTLTVADTAADLLALSGDLSLDGATQMTADASLTAAQAQTLANDPNFSTGGHVLTIVDSAANLLALPVGVQALSGHLVLNADQSVSAAQAASLLALGGAFSTGGHVLTVTDTAAALLAMPQGVSAFGTLALSGDATVSAAQFTSLTTALSVGLNGHALTISDTPANLLTLSGPSLGQASAVSLSADGTVSEAQFLTLRDTLAVSGSGHSLNVTDTAANLLALSGDLSLVSATTLSAPATLDAAQATLLAAEPGFSTGGQMLGVTDTAANLLALSSGVQALSGHLALAASQSVSAAQVSALAALGPAFSTNGHALTVTDTATALLGLSPGAQALAGAYALSADATVSAAQFATLEGSLSASLNGHVLTVSDTPAQLLAIPLQLLGAASAFSLSAGGTVSAAQLSTLRDVLGVAGNGHTLDLSDTAANLLALSGDLSLVGTTQLSADATLNAAQAQSLAAAPGFGTGGHVLTITDTAANLLGLPTGVTSLSGHLVLAGSQSVSAAQVTALAALGAAFSTGGATLTVTDTASALLSLSPAADALAGAMALSADATVDAAQFAALATTLQVGLNGHALMVSDTPANLLGLPLQSLSQATGFSLSAGGTVSQAQFLTLRDTIGVAGNGHTLVVSDTAANLLSLSGDLSLVGATQLSADGSVNAAQATTLAAEPGFGLAGHVLSITDTAANLLGLSTNVQLLSGHLVLAGSQTVSAAQVTALAALGSAFSEGGHTLTVSDTAANLLSLSPGASALAGAYALSADATVSAAQFTTLTATLHAGLAGHALVVSDTASNLLALPPQAWSNATGFSLSADGTVSQAQFVTLRDAIGVSGNGHTLSVTDTAANLLALGGDLSLVGSTQLAANATLSAAQAQTLAGEPGFSTNGHVLTVTDSAANLLGLSTQVQTVSGHLVLGGSQSVTAQQAAGLAALGGIFSTGGNTLTVTDTAASLLSLPGGVASIAGAYALSADGSVNAAGFTTLIGTLHVALGGHTLIVQDNPANLLGIPPQYASEGTFFLTSGGTVSEAQFVTLRDTFGAYGHPVTVSDTASDLLALSGNLIMDSATLLSADATVNAAQAIALAGEPGFATAGHVLSITDTAANLLALPTSLQTLSGNLVLAGSQSVNASQAAGLAALGGAFSTGGNTLTVTDTAANLLSLPAGVAAIAGAYALSADATINASQFTALRDVLGVSLNGHAITIVDSAPALAGLTGSLADASACILSANGTVSAAGAAVLAGEPGFSTAGHTLTIADTAANLLSLSAPLQSLANGFTLSANQTVSVAQLAGLAGYGIKFSDGAYTLNVADTAAHLAGLTAPELALVGSVTLSQTAVVSAAAATVLAALPGFALGAGASLTVQDNAANLLALPGAVLEIAAQETLPSGTFTLSAAQAAGLNALPQFQENAGTHITVQDNVANLLGNAGWYNVANATHVVDTAATLAANASNIVLEEADTVTLSANATVSAAQAVSLSTLNGYSSGAYTLTVADSAAAIAQNATAINQVGTTALVNTAAAVTAAQAESLTLLSGAGKLNFLAGDTLTVSDSYAALTSNANAAGVALASTIVITDSAANLAIAASHNWGSLVPTYVLSANATITGAQAIALAGLGSHFVAGYTLSVQDSAANVVAASSALTSLGITATVSDTAADIGAQANALLGLGGHLAAVQVSDGSAISPASAAGLAPLAGKLTGSAIAVAGNAASVDANLAALETLGTHVAITLTGNAASVAANAADLANLGSALTISLTDSAPVTASVAAGAGALAARFAAGTTLDVTDTVADIAAVSGGLTSMGSALGTITLSGGNAANLSQVVSLLPLDSHLGTGVGLAVAAPAGDITVWLSSLLALRSDGHLSSVTDSGEAASTVIANASALNAVGAIVNVSDSLAGFNASAADLAGISGLASVFIYDTPNPTFTLSLTQYAAEGAVIGLVTNAHSVVISDTAAHIEADLASASSVLLGMSGVNYTLSVTGGAPLVLSQAVAIEPAVQAVLSHFGGAVQVTGVDVAHLAAVAAVTTSGISLADSTENLQEDLGLPANGSVVLAHIAAISSITASGGGTIGVTAFQALQAGFDDGPNSVFGKLTGAGLVVTDASVSQANTLIGATVAPVGIYVDDIAANITAALINPSSPIMTALSTVVNLNVLDGQAIVLTEAQDTAANVNDSAHAALTKVSGGAIDVTGVTTAQLGTVEGGAVTPTQVSIADTGADIAAALTTLLSDRANLGAITITSGQVVLSVSQALMAHVADGAGSLVSLLPGQAYAVSGATVAQVASLIALAQAPGAIGVSDSSANIAADLTASSSQIAAHASSVTIIGGTLSLTDAQAHSIVTNGHAAALGLIGSGQTIDIGAVPVADIGTFSALHSNLAGGVTLQLEVSDTALALATDLGQGGGSLLTSDAAYVNSVTLTGAGGTLTAAQLGAVAGVSGLNANGYSVPVSDGASAIANLGAGARALAGTHVTVNDTAGNVGAVLGTLQSAYNGGLAINLTDGGTITLTAAQYSADLPTVDAITNLSRIVVTGGAAAIAAIEPTLAGDAHVNSVQVTDSAANIVANLGAIAALGGSATVTVNAGSISASLAQALVNANLPNLVTTGVTVHDTGAQLAAMAESSSACATFLNSHSPVVTADSNVRLVDAQALSGLSNLSKGGHAINVWDTAAYLTAPGAAAALNTLTTSGFIGGIYLKTSGGSVTLTAANTLSLLGISGLSTLNPDGSANTITVADTAANLDASRVALQSAGAGCIAAYVINASATVNGTVLSDLQGISATTAPGVSLTLSDTASNILAAAAVSGASVQASAWNLSANASVTSNQVLSLAALPNFSAAGHTLTVALSSNTALGSVTLANELGAIGANLIVTGHVYTISGSVSSLSGLTSAGAAVAHVALSDNFLNLYSLSASSPLLTGTITVTDYSNPTAGTVQSFLSTLSTAGVSDSNVSFAGGAQIAVYDTVDDLRTLTSSTAWSSNAALQSHIPLNAYDNAADLDNPANTAFLNSLNGQVLRASDTVSAAGATALNALSHFSLGGHSLTVSDTATNLLNGANSAGLALASSIQLSGAASLNAAQAEQLLQMTHFTLTQTLNISDSSASLLDGTLQGLIAGNSFVHVSLAAPETVDAHVASELASLQGFSDTTNMNIVDSSSYLLAPGASAAESVAASVSLAGDETVSANTILRLEEIPHFIATGGTLSLAGDDFANAPTLKAIADLGSHFSEGGHNLTLTQDDLGLTPTEYAAIQSDGFVANGHVISAQLVSDSVTDTSNTMALTATGVAGASVSVYDHSGTLLSSTIEGSASFTVSAPDSGSGGNFSITETVGGVESAPVVVLNASTLEGLVSGASSSFSNSGEIQVGAGEYLNLYTAGASLPNAPALVYDPTAHTISLDIPNASPVVLVTLGASTHPASIDPTEILVKHHS